MPVAKRPAKGSQIIISVPASVSKDLSKMRKITEKTLGILACPNCHSGYDLLFKVDLPVIRFNEKLESMQGF